jgi:hypothetical protein
LQGNQPNEKAILDLISVDGKVIQSLPITDAGFHQLQFDVSGLEKGMYFVRLNAIAANEQSIQRFIKD